MLAIKAANRFFPSIQIEFISSINELDVLKCTLDSASDWALCVIFWRVQELACYCLFYSKKYIIRNEIPWLRVQISVKTRYLRLLSFNIFNGYFKLIKVGLKAFTYVRYNVYSDTHVVKLGGESLNVTTLSWWDMVNNCPIRHNELPWRSSVAIFICQRLERIR